jgi:hypothetical protein
MNWQNEARRVFRAEIVRRGATYQRLAWRLQQIGVKASERSPTNCHAGASHSSLSYSVSRLWK